tara:strand:- start:321 stop:518 length:198 start_codon:yes stop_codon:yes gene_type:complete
MWKDEIKKREMAELMSLIKQAMDIAIKEGESAIGADLAKILRAVKRKDESSRLYTGRRVQFGDDH